MKLLAKGSNCDIKETTLQNHSVVVFKTAEKLINLYGEKSIESIGLNSCHFGKLQRIVSLAAIIHDLGKCSNHFQFQVNQDIDKNCYRLPSNYEKDHGQLYRHEILIWFLTNEVKNFKNDQAENIRNFLKQYVQDDFEWYAALCAASGHHRKHKSELKNENSSIQTTIICLVNNESFNSLLNSIKRNLKLEKQCETIDDDIVIEYKREYSIDIEESALGNLLDDDNFKKIVGIAKSFLICSDVVGSILNENEKKIFELEKILKSEVDKGVYDTILTDKLNKNKLREFQTEISESENKITFVRAGCGSGKTLAGYAWVKNQYPTKKLWFCYPTTNTSLEGFRDYLQGLNKEGKIDATLESSRSDIDNEIFNLELESKDEFNSITFWKQDVVCCTVHTILGLLEHYQKGHLAWIGLSNSAIVFDEIHSYDDRLFHYLLQFLNIFKGIPVLLMTASLPNNRLEKLKKISKEMHDQDLLIIDGPKELEETKRYKIEKVEIVSKDKIKSFYANGKKILIVCNTVARAIELFNSLKKETEIKDIICYHSRFKYIDRVNQHKKVIEAFNSDKPIVVISTQVAEMSLDISADILISELSTVPSLIQRLGRLNRKNPVGEIKNCYILIPKEITKENSLPYKKIEREKAIKWIDSLIKDQELSQKDLIDKWENKENSYDDTSKCSYIANQVETMDDGEIVENNENAITVILQEDFKKYQNNKIELQKREIPMTKPKQEIEKPMEKKSYFYIINDDKILYDEKTGASWRR